MRAALLFSVILLSRLAASVKPPPGWEWEDAVTERPVAEIPIPPVNGEQLLTSPSPCLKECFKRKFDQAGCGSADHWDCLCRTGGVAPEVVACARTNCKTERDVGSLKLQNVMCRKASGFWTGNAGDDHLYDSKEKKKQKNA